MNFRSGLSPVLLYEAIAGSRRWQGYLLRALLVLGMLLALWFAWVSLTAFNMPGSFSAARQMAELGQYFYHGVAGIQLGLALLAAPAATAGAVCVDRSRGWLEHLFVTHLSDAEIVLGKFAARFATMLAFVLAGLPVLAISSLFGGIIPEAIVLLTIVTLAVCLLGCSLAMLLSVRMSRPHEVLMVVFAIWAVWLLSLPLYLSFSSVGLLPPPPGWLADLNPFVLVYSPYLRPGSLSLLDVVVFVLLSLLLSAGFIAVAILLVRREHRGRRESPEWHRALREFVRGRLFSWWPSPSLDANPVLWREWHRDRPSRMARIVTWVFVIVTTLGMAGGLYAAIRNGIGVGGGIVQVSSLAVVFGLLLLSATAPTSLTEERVRGSLDILMSTPLPTHQIVLGKWWATYRRTLPLLALPALTGVFISFAATGYPFFLPAALARQVVEITTTDRILAATLPSLFLLAHASLTTSLGLAAATWLKRTGQAVGASVTAFVIGTFGWVLAVEVGFRHMMSPLAGPGRSISYEALNSLTQALVALSPLGGQSTPVQFLMYHWNQRRWPGLLIQFGSVLVLLVLAAALLGLTLLTFDRCMGRIEGHRHRPAPRRAEEVPPLQSPAASMA